MSLLSKRISEIADPDLQSLIEEMREVTMAQPESGMLLLHFLQQCHHPMGASEKWCRIEKAQIIPGRFLSRKIGKLQAPAVLGLCLEIGARKGLGLEAIEGITLYEFFNKHTPHLFKPEKKRPHDPRDTLRRMGF